MEKLKVLYSKGPWIMLISLVIILLGSALQVFLDLNKVLKIIIAVIVFLSFIVLGACLLARESRSGAKQEKSAVYKLQAKSKAAKSVEDIMTITYAAVVVLGTFCDSLLVIGIGIFLFVMHTAISIISWRYYLNYFKDK